MEYVCDYDSDFSDKDKTKPCLAVIDMKRVSLRIRHQICAIVSCDNASDSASSLSEKTLDLYSTDDVSEQSAFEEKKKKKKRRKKKRKRYFQSRLFEVNEREVITVETLTENTMFNLPKDFVNKELLAFQTTHYQIGNNTNGRMCFSTHQIHNLALADKSTFGWPVHVDSFSHVFMLINLDPLSQLNLVLLMRSSNFKDVVSIALLMKMTKIKSSALSNTDEEMSPEDSISWAFTHCIDILNHGGSRWRLKQICDVKTDLTGFQRAVAVVVRIPEHETPPSSLLSQESSSGGDGGGGGGGGCCHVPYVQSSVSSSSDSMPITPRKESNIQCLRNLPKSQQDWTLCHNSVRPPKEVFSPFDLVLLDQTNKFANKQLGFYSSIGFQGGSRALGYESCLTVMEAMQVTSESRILDCGCGLFRLGLLLACVSNYTVVCTDLPYVINNINNILSVTRPGVVNMTNDIYFENSIRALCKVTEVHSIVVFNVVDNTSEDPFNSSGVPNMLYLDRTRCSALQLKFPVATVWTLSDSDPYCKNRNHLCYKGLKDLKTVCMKMSECSLLVCDYLSLTKANCAAVIASFLDFALATLHFTEKYLTSKTVVVFPNRVADARRHRELTQYFEVKYIKKESFEWFRIGEACESEICRSLESNTQQHFGFNIKTLEDINVVYGAEFAVLYRRAELPFDSFHTQQVGRGRGKNDKNKHSKSSESIGTDVDEDEDEDEL